MINKLLKKHGLTMAQFHKKYPTEEAFAAAHPEDYNALQQFANGGKVSLSAGGEEHLIYKKQSPTGNGKGVKGHIMVNHPTMNKGKWDTIDLTDVAGAQTVAEGIAATKKWHAENPEYKNGGMIKRADGSYSKRGLWDNIRANRGSGKKPTKQMLEQEAKIKAQHAEGGYITNDLSLDEYGNGGYIVKRSHERKGKTHVVIGPDGTKKYFGDSKLGQHPNDPERKKAFYARHKHNLANNPYFRAFARKTWAEGGTIGEEEFDQYADGGIHIKPENKGKFTAWAKSHGMGVQEAASHVMANKDKYSSTIVKRANFAKNAAKFKHANGGKIDEVYATSMQKTNNDGNTFVNAAYNVNPDGETSYQYNKQTSNPNSTPYGINYFGNNVTGNQMSTYGPNGVNYFKADPIMNNFLKNRSRSLSGGMTKYPGGGSTGLLQSYYDSQGGPGFKGGVFGSGYLKGDVNHLGYNASAGLNLNPVMLGIGYGNMMGKDMPFVEGQITPSLGSFGSRRGPQGNVYGVAAGKYYADPNQMDALQKNLMDPNASAVMGRAGLGVNLKPSYRSKFGFSGEGGYDIVNDQPYFNAGVRYNIGDGGNTNGCGRGPKHKSYGRLDFAEGGLTKYDMGGPTLTDIEDAKVTTPAVTTPKTGLTTYQGGVQKTPTGQSNAFSNNQFNLTDSSVTAYAKQYNLPTDNNANFQSAQLKMLQGTPQGQALLNKMDSTFGATKAGKYNDGILGARTQYLIQNDSIANPPKPNGYGQTWTKSIDANGNTVLTGRDGTVKVLPKKADSTAVANTLKNDMLTRRVPLATKAMGGTIGRSLKKYGDAGTVATSGVATTNDTSSNGMFEVVGKGKGWKNPNMASAGIGAGAQVAELALSKVPNNEYTDDEGNVVGSSTNTWAGVGKGAAQGAATGAALGPWGALAGAVVGGAMGYLNSAEEEEAAKKAQVASNNRISLKRIRGKANESAGLTQTMGTQLYPYGGSINTDQEGANAELELNEQFMLPGGEVGQVNGPSHDEGGIEVALPEGTKVFSDRLKLNGKTYAEHAKKINNKIRSLDRKPDSLAKTNTEMLFNQQLNNLFNAQEEYKSQRDANFAQQFAQGGTIGSWEIIED